MSLLLLVGGLSIYAVQNIKTKNNTISELNILAVSLRADFNYINGQLVEFRKQVVDLTDGNSKLKNTINGLADTNSKLTENFNSISGQLVEARTTIAELTKRLDDISSRLSTVREIVGNITSGSGKAEDLIREIISGFNKLRETIIGEGSGV